MNTANLLQFLFSGLMVGAIYGLVALGFNIVFNATGAVNFAQGEFAMLGGMLGASLLSATGLPLRARHRRHRRRGDRGRAS